MSMRAWFVGVSRASKCLKESEFWMGKKWWLSY